MFLTKFASEVIPSLLLRETPRVDVRPEAPPGEDVQDEAPARTIDPVESEGTYLRRVAAIERVDRYEICQDED